MADLPSRAHLATHEVTNQPPAEGDRDLWAGDTALREAVAREAGRPEALAPYGATLGTTEIREAGRTANDHPPELKLFDRAGRRLDAVEFHPAYHRMMALSTEAGYAALPWDGAPGGGPPAPAPQTLRLRHHHLPPRGFSGLPRVWEFQQGRGGLDVPD